MGIHWPLSSKHYSLVTLSLQQEVATEAALTLVPHTVVLAIHTHSILFCGTLRHPVLNLLEGQRKTDPWNLTKSKNKDSAQNTSIWAHYWCICFYIMRMSQEWQALTLLGSRGKSRGFSRAFLCSSRDKHTPLFLLQNSQHERQVPPPLAEPTNRVLHFSQCLP